MCITLLWLVAGEIASRLDAPLILDTCITAVSHVLSLIAFIGIIVGGVGMMPWIRKRIAKRSRRAALVSLVSGVVCLVLSAGCASPRWDAREELAAEVTFPVVYNKGYNLSIFGFERKTIFDTHRYEKVFAALVDAGVTSRETAVIPREVTDEELRLVYTREWVRNIHNPAVVASALETGIIARLPRAIVSDRITAPFRMQTRGTVLAAKYALERGMACTLGGGFSHAKSDGGEGFNLFADVPLAVAELRKSGWNGKVLILDVDVHHGQGNAIFFQNDASVFVIDVYNRENYPYEFEKVDVAIELRRGAGDEEYISRLSKELPAALDSFAPDLVIYVCGVDCSKNDRIGGLAITREGLFQRDKLVIDECVRRKIPLCITLSGGYWQGSAEASARMIEYAARKQGMRR